MIAVDTNILVYAQREAAPERVRAVAALERLATGADPWGIPAFVPGEFLRVVTHRTIDASPDALRRGSRALDALLASPSARLLSPGARFWPILRAVAERSRARGNLVHDAQIVAVCLERGVGEILSEDRDLLRFRDIRVVTLDEFLSRSR